MCDMIQVETKKGEKKHDSNFKKQKRCNVS